jgi:hypothetical protein
MAAREHRRRRIRVVALLAVVAGGRAAHAQPIITPADAGPVPGVVVRVANEARLPNHVLLAAQQRATEIFQTAGVSVRWRVATGYDDWSTNPDEGSVAVLVVVASGRLTEVICGVNRVSPHALGAAMVRERRLAYVFVDRIWELAARKQLMPGSMTGDVIAHEVGHLLLPDHEHARDGVMRENVDARPRPPAHFSETEAAALRARLARP